MENKMSEWLAHPMEFNAKPKAVKYIGSETTTMNGSDRFLVHLVEYTMPDDTYGKGFAAPVAWAFVGALPWKQLTNTQLVRAYTGWLSIFQVQNNGKLISDFKPKTLERLQAKLAAAGLSKVEITNKYKVADSEFFEFKAERVSGAVKGAGDENSFAVFDLNAPEASLPVIYTWLGKELRGE
jgi:hypothetical protein